MLGIRNRVKEFVLRTFVDGERLPIGGPMPSTPASSYRHPVRLHTGKMESELLGALLIKLAVVDGEWRMVPLRMLRNEYLAYPTWKRVLERNKRRIEFLTEEPMVTYVIGGPTPDVEFQIGITDLHEHRLVRVISQAGEMYFVPTDALLKCVIGGPRSLTDFLVGGLEHLARNAAPVEEQDGSATAAASE